MAEIQVENVQNAIVGSTVTTAGGDVLVNGQKVTNYFYSSQYQDLKKQLDTLEARFLKTQQKIKEYPNDEDFKTDLLQIDGERTGIRNKLDDLKREVIRLAETFTKIPTDTERLKLARQYFEAGDYAAAHKVLDAKQMGIELDSLLNRDEQLQQQQAEIRARRTDMANEFLIKARLTALDVHLPGWFEKTVDYFKQSLKAAFTLDNVFEYAFFLHQHNDFNTALPFYEKALTACRGLAETDPQTYLPHVATTLNHLAILQAAKNEFPAAQTVYNEALEIRRRLAETNPQTYLPDVAQTLNNLATLQADKNEFPAAGTAYNEALAIRRRLAETNPQTYLPN